MKEWEAINESLHDEAEQIFKESVNLRKSIDDHVLKSSAKRLRDQADAVDIAMARFMYNTQHISRAIEIDLERVMK